MGKHERLSMAGLSFIWSASSDLKINPCRENALQSDTCASCKSHPATTVRLVSPAHSVFTLSANSECVCVVGVAISPPVWVYLLFSSRTETEPWKKKFKMNNNTFLRWKHQHWCTNTQTHLEMLKSTVLTTLTSQAVPDILPGMWGWAFRPLEMLLSRCFSTWL